MSATRLGESQRRILEHLKRRGTGTTPEIAKALALSVETVRTHLRALGSEGLVARLGRRRRGPGRPEILYGLTEASQGLFPNEEGKVLRDLATFLETKGQPALVRAFFDDFVDRRRAAVQRRLAGLAGDRRLEEVARVLTEDGFMAEVATDDEGRRLLRLCHCPLRTLVGATKAPCRSELRFIREMLGKDLDRVSYIPAGGPSCTYAIAPRG
ncbi:MAG: helix-turn-helix domain-containing protein [Gemmatimonadales bacterium]